MPALGFLLWYFHSKSHPVYPEPSLLTLMDLYEAERLGS